MKAFVNHNEEIKAYLDRLLEKQIVPHSLLFAGPKSASKENLALEFARKLIGCNEDQHPDLHLLKPEGKIGMHSMETLRQFKQEVFLPPYSAKLKVFIIYEAERMLTYSANALLKTFEEPPSYCIVLLLSHFPEQLLPTILSRCHTLYFRGDKTEHLHSNPFLMEFLSASKPVSYSRIVKAARQLKEQLESSIETASAEPPDGQELTSYQLQMLEKQQEGSLALSLLKAAEDLFLQILCWFRDMLLLQYNGEKSLLFHAGYIDKLSQACQRGEFAPIEGIQKALQDAKLALERSTPLQHVLENLLLKVQGLIA